MQSSRNRWISGRFHFFLGLLLVNTFLLHASSDSVEAQTRVYLNSTGDSTPSDERFCSDAPDCTLRRAIKTAADDVRGGQVVACFDPDEVPNARRCPDGVIPLRKSDPNYDPVLDKWIIKLGGGTPIVMVTQNTFVDLRQGLDWESPADNRIIVDASSGQYDHAFALESNNNILAGFEIRGTFSTAAILIRGGVTRDLSHNNQLGPGLIFANMPQGAGIKIVAKDTHNNKIIGNWCGITGDGTELSPLTDDCIHLGQGTTGNVIGDLTEENRNVFGATTSGSGIRIEDSEFVGLDVQTKNNRIENNWFGLDAEGNSIEGGGLDTGILLEYAPFNIINKNVVSNNRNAGIVATGLVSETQITENIIGGAPDGLGCRGNFRSGIRLLAGANSNQVISNRIICNNGSGVEVQGRNSINNRISKNSISQSRTLPISITSNGNSGVKAPKILKVDSGVVEGSACPNCSVEVYSDPDKEADHFEGETVADGEGNWRLEFASGTRHLWLSALAIDGNGNSSQLSNAQPAPSSGGRTPSPTSPPPSFTPRVSPTSETPSPPVEKNELWLPMLFNLEDMEG